MGIVHGDMLHAKNGRSEDSQKEETEASVSDRLAALKVKLQQSRQHSSDSHHDVPNSIINHDVTNVDEDGVKSVHVSEEFTGGEHNRVQGTLEAKVMALQGQLEREVAKNGHIIGLYEDQRDQLEQLQKEHDIMGRDAAEQIEGMRQKYDGVVRRMQDLERELHAQQSDLAAQNQIIEANRALEMQVKDLKSEIQRLGKGNETRHAHSDSPDDLRQELVKSNTELKFAKDQLQRLKSQMVAAQDDVEDQIRWRVDAEVKLRLEELGIGPHGEMPVRDAQLLGDLEIALEKIQESDKELEHLKTVVHAKEAELRNMQIALSELSYESETAEKLRVQVRSLEDRMRSKDDEVEAAKLNCMEFEKKAMHALEQLAEEKRKAAAAREAEGTARQEMISLQISYNDLASKLKGADNIKTYDRAFLIKLLKDMASLRHSQAIQTAAQALSLTEDERTFVMGDSSSSFADTWVNFLESQVKDDVV